MTPRLGIRRNSVSEGLLESVPDYREFYTVDELNSSSEELALRHPDKVSLTTIGKARSGEKIQALKIGSGKKVALMFGFPHPNEPIGSMTLEHLSNRLVEDTSLDSLDYTWYLVKCIDPDGARLNEGWFKGRFTPLKYALGYYRPPLQQQVEWTFPIEYKTHVWKKPLPETKALMGLINMAKPQFMYSLHNSGFGGVYFFLSEPCRPLYSRLQTVVKNEGLPLHSGEPESPYMKRYSRAIFESPTVAQEYEFLNKNTGEDPAELMAGGSSSGEYARRVAGTFTLICEMPYFYDPRIEDASLSDVTRKEACLYDAKCTEEILDFTKRVYSKARKLVKSHRDRRPFIDSVESRLRTLPEYLEAQRNWAITDKTMTRKATVAEKFDSFTAMRFYDVLNLGMLYRCIVDTGNEQAEEQVLRHIKEDIRDFTKQLSFRVIPIRSLVRVQLGSALATARQLSKGTRC